MTAGDFKAASAARPDGEMDDLVHRLRTAKLSSEIFLQSLAPNYLGVYLVDLGTDQMSSVITPEYFRTIVRRHHGAYQASIQDYCTEIVAREDQAAFVAEIDYDVVRQKTKAGEAVNFTYRRRDGLLVRLVIEPFAAGGATDLFWWIFTDEENEHTVAEELLEACWRLIPGRNERETYLTWNAGFQRLMDGITDQTSATLREAIVLVHPDDRPFVEQQLRNVLESGTESCFDMWYRLRRKEGGYRCIRSIGKALRGRDGRVEKICGFSLDVSEPYRMLLTQKKLLEGLLREYSTVWLVDGKTLKPRLWQRKLQRSVFHESVAETEEKSYQEGFQDYAERCVADVDRAEFLRQTDWSIVKEKLRSGGVYRVVHRRQFPQGVVYYQASFVAVDPSDETSDFAVGFQNVDEVVTADQKKSEALAKALDAEEAAKRDLAASLAKVTEDKRILDALSSDFMVVYHVDLTTGAFDVLGLKEQTNTKALLESKRMTNFDDYVSDYCDRYMRPEEAGDLREALRCSRLREALEKSPRVTFHHRILPNRRGQQHFEVQIIRTGADEGRQQAIIGMRCVDDIMAKEQAAKETLQAALTKVTEGKRILDALSSDFIVVYYIELNTGAFEVVSLSKNTNVNGLLENGHYEHFDDYARVYCDRFVAPEDVPAVREAFRCGRLKAELEKSPRVIFHYRSRPNPSGKQYFEVQVIRVPTDDGRFLVLMGARYIDDIMDKEKAVQAKLQQALEESQLHNEIISAIGKSYQYIARVDIAANFYEEIAATGDQYHLSGRSGRFDELVTQRLIQRIAEPYREAMLQFTDLSKLPERLKDEEAVVLECELKDGNWHKYRFIVKKRDESGVVTHVLLTIRRISNEKRNEESLLYMAECARREAEVKSQFLSNMSHDIRTPLNGILGSVDLAEQHPDDLAVQAKARESVREKVLELTAIVNNVLDLSKLESGDFEEQSIVFDLAEVLRRENAKIEAQALQKGVKYRVDFDFSTLTHTQFEGNPVYLARILQNVGENAVKFSKPGGEVRVWSTERSFDGEIATIEFCCEDHGIGMSEAFAKKAFDLFTQEAQTSRTKYSGTGMGLAIVKKLIDRCGGTVELKTKKGEGTTVVMTLPLRVATAAKAAPLHWEDVTVEGRRVLVVEDNELNMEIACCLLEASGIEVERAVDGLEAVEKFKASEQGHFDAVFMDIMMPRMDGLEATRAIRALDRRDAAKVPIIAMSANAFAEDVAKSRIAGMNDHLAKPINETMVVNALKKCLAAAGR